VNHPAVPHFRPGAASLARSGFGWMVSANAHAVWWTHLADGRQVVRVRAPGSVPTDPVAACPRPDGGWVDVGDAVVGQRRMVPTLPSGRRTLGHAIVERRGEQLIRLDTGPLGLPEGAVCHGARPWPWHTGWAWTDGDTAYRCGPDHRAHVVGRVPGTIRHWDVGPHGAMWFTGAGCLWLAGPGQYARRATEAVEAALGLPSELLEAGALVFADDGRALALAESPSARRIHLARRPAAGAEVGDVVGLSPAPLPFPPDPSPAVAHPFTDTVVRLDDTWLESWDGCGLRARRRHNLFGAPLAIGVHDGVLTVLTGAGLVAFDPTGRSCSPHPASLNTEPGAHGIHSTPTGSVWWSVDGAVVPLAEGVLFDPSAAA